MVFLENCLILETICMCKFDKNYKLEQMEFGKTIYTLRMLLPPPLPPATCAEVKLPRLVGATFLTRTLVRHVNHGSHSMLRADGTPVSSGNSTASRTSCFLFFLCKSRKVYWCCYLFRTLSIISLTA